MDDPIMAKYNIDKADLSGTVSGQPPLTTQFKKKNGNATAMLPAVIAIG